MRQNDRRRAKWAIDKWRARARMSPGEGDSGEDGSASEYERAENASQEVRPSLMVSRQTIKSSILLALISISRHRLDGSPSGTYCSAWTAGDLEERSLRASFPPCSEGNHHRNNRRAQPNFAASWNGGVGEALDFRRYQDLGTIANSLRPRVLVPSTGRCCLLGANSMTMRHGPTRVQISEFFLLLSCSDGTMIEREALRRWRSWEPRLLVRRIRSALEFEAGLLAEIEAIVTIFYWLMSTFLSSLRYWADSHTIIATHK